MQALDYWRLCDELTIDEAAHLMIGSLPGEIEANLAQGNDLTPQSAVRYSIEITAARNALTNAVSTGKVPARTRDGSDDSVLLVEDIKNWLITRGLRPRFFFPSATAAPDYLNPSHSRYAPKLAAAVSAWLAVDAIPDGKTVKQSLEKWLRENASQYKLTDEDGRSNDQGIEECAKVANWRPGGGAPKTPSK